MMNSSNVETPEDRIQTRTYPARGPINRLAFKTRQ
jgi:hypothetical protein